jgi:hypothetical protein
MANDTRRITDKPEILPGSPQEWWRAPAKNLRTNRLLRDLEETKLEDDTSTFGGVPATINDVLLFNGVTWVPVDITALLSLDDLTDVVLSAASANDFLRFNGSEWTNQTVVIVSVLDDLADVIISAPVSGQVVQYNGSSWVNASLVEFLSLTQLSDVLISAPATAQTLRYNGSGWVNAALALDDLADVVISGPATGHGLRYNGANWVNAFYDHGTDLLGLTDDDHTQYIHNAPGSSARNVILPTGAFVALTLKAPASGTANQLESLDNAGSAAARFRILSTGVPSCPDAFVLTERFGAGAAVSGASGTAIGASASAGLSGTALGKSAVASGNGGSAFAAFSSASGTDSIGFGILSTASGTRNIAIGRSASATGANASIVIGGNATDGGFDRCIIIGDNAAATSADGLAIGRGAQTTGGLSFGNTTVSTTGLSIGGSSTSGSNGVAIGSSAASTGNGGIAIGLSASASAFSIAIGLLAAAAADSQVVIGGTFFSNPADVYFGKGVTHASPLAAKIQPPGGLGSNIAGPDLILAGGKSTGSAVGGQVKFQSTIAAGSSSTLNTLQDKMVLTNDGILQFWQRSSTSDRLAADLTTTLPTATDASRTSRTIWSMTDFAATREVMRAEATGSAAALGFLGATAVARQGSTSDLKDVFVNFGLLTDGGATPLNLDAGAMIAGNYAEAVVTKTANYTLTAADGTIRGDATGGAFTLTLPTAVGISGRMYSAKKVDATANVVTVATTGGETIDGAATASLAVQYSSLSFRSNNVNWDLF